jgi:EmrB/QacA subfamily drug resistance transporter
MLRSLLPDDRRWVALGVVLCAAFMALLDVFVVFVSAPSIALDLHASPGDVEWIVAAYALAFALGLITGGRLGDLLGRRRVFSLGLVVFALGSLLCGAAPSPAALIGARVLQGLGAAAMMPQVLSMIQVEFAPRERARALAIMGAVQGAASVGGQLVGGALIGLDVLGLGWRTVFLVNLPIAAVALVLAPRLVPESRAPEARRLDLAGVALAVPALAAVAVPLVEGRSAGWPWWTFASFAAAVPLGLAFLAWQRHVRRAGGSPLVALELFALRPFRLGIGLSFVVYTGVPGLMLVIMLFLQDGLGLAPLEAGLAFAPGAVAFSASSFTVGRLSVAARERLLVPAISAVGVGLAAAAAIALAAGDPAPVALTPAFILLGAGQGVVIPALNGIVLSETPARFAGSASGLLATAQQIGGALGVAVAGTVFFGRLGTHAGPVVYGQALAAATVYVCTMLLVSSVLAWRLTHAAAPAAAIEVVRAG